MNKRNSILFTTLYLSLFFAVSALIQVKSQGEVSRALEFHGESPTDEWMEEVKKIIMEKGVSINVETLVIPDDSFAKLCEEGTGFPDAIGTSNTLEEASEKYECIEELDKSGDLLRVALGFKKSAFNPNDDPYFMYVNARKVKAISRSSLFLNEFRSPRAVGEGGYLVASQEEYEPLNAEWLGFNRTAITHYCCIHDPTCDESCSSQ